MEVPPWQTDECSKRIVENPLEVRRQHCQRRREQEWAFRLKY